MPFCVKWAGVGAGPHGPGLAAVVAMLVALSPAEASSQALRPVERSLPPAASFLTWLEVADEYGRPMRRIGFRHQRFKGDEGPVLYVIARKDTYEGSDVSQTHWVDGRSCPAIMEAMQQLADLPVPDRNVPGLPLPRPPELPPRVMDGNLYTINTTGEMPDRHLTQTRLISNAGPVAEWGRFVERELEPCWAPGLAP